MFIDRDITAALSRVRARPPSTQNRVHKKKIGLSHGKANRIVFALVVQFGLSSHNARLEQQRCGFGLRFGFALGKIRAPSEGRSAAPAPRGPVGEPRVFQSAGPGRGTVFAEARARHGEV
jgi:hypothetical protein